MVKLGMRPSLNYVPPYTLTNSGKNCSPSVLYKPLNEGLIFVSGADDAVVKSLRLSISNEFIQHNKNVLRISNPNSLPPPPKTKDLILPTFDGVSKDEDFESFCELTEEIEEGLWDAIFIEGYYHSTNLALAAVLGSQGYLVILNEASSPFRRLDAVDFLNKGLKNNYLLEMFWEGYEDNAFLGEPVEEYLIKRSIYSDCSREKVRETKIVDVEIHNWE